MALKDEWKETGKGLGSAFKGLAKNVGRSVDTALSSEEERGESDVFNDGSWRKTGKELGGAFKGLARSIVDSAREGIDRLEDDEKDDKKEK